MVDLAVAHRRTVSSILNDPLIVRFFTEHESFRLVMDRMTHVLVGDDIGHEARVATAMLTAAISGTVTRLVTGLDDETLRSQLAQFGPTPPPRYQREVGGTVAPRSCRSRPAVIHGANMSTRKPPVNQRVLRYGLTVVRGAWHLIVG